MINSESNTIELGTNVPVPTPTFQKQPVLAAKKVALRDVQNNNNNSNSNSNVTRNPHPESLLPVDVQPLMDVSKTSGTKRPTPDYASSHDVFTKNNANEHLNYPRRNLGYPRSVNRPQVQQNVQYGSVVAPNQTGSKAAVPRFMESQDELRTDRFIRLQNFIKQCDGSDNTENIQLLLRLSPSDLSKHAVELEKRAIQLTIEEGKEMQRIQALNILGKSSTTRTPMPMQQHKN